MLGCEHMCVQLLSSWFGASSVLHLSRFWGSAVQVLWSAVGLYLGAVQVLSTCAKCCRLWSASASSCCPAAWELLFNCCPAAWVPVLACCEVCMCCPPLSIRCLGFGDASMCFLVLQLGSRAAIGQRTFWISPPHTLLHVFSLVAVQVLHGSCAAQLWIRDCLPLYTKPRWLSQCFRSMEKDILQTKIVFTSFIVQTDFGQDNHMSLDLNPISLQFYVNTVIFFQWPNKH
jgi:hypothetical protein